MANSSDVLNRRFRMLIGGKLVEAADGARFISQNPATGEDLGSAPDGKAADVDLAVAAAQAAQPAWRSLPLNEKQTLLREVCAALRARSEELGLLDSLDTGNVLSAMRQDAPVGAAVIEYFLGASNEIKGEVTHLDGDLHYTRRQPFGVAAKFLPFNHPIGSLAGALAPPLLAGNCLILKPSPHTPLSALAFGETLAEILPAGVVNIITGSNEALAEPLAAHPGVPRLALQTSIEAGRNVLRLAADHMKTVTLELGGKNPLIVFEDADVEFAASTAVAAMNFKWQAHSCSSTSRVLVHALLHDAFVARLAELLGDLKIGSPLDPETEMGAITHRAQYDRITSYIETGKAEGASLVYGGTPPNDPALADGLFLTPALFTDVTPGMRIAREEVFGPVIAVMPWDDYDEMIETANDVEYGLAAVLVTDDLNRAHLTAEALDVGYVEVNGPVSFAFGSPFGGIKQSGMGREGGFDELLSYTQVKSVNIRLRRDGF
ncbi:MAG: aldehyde dehydrogenase family protein [Pseudomonadota bacterium]